MSLIYSAITSLEKKHVQEDMAAEGVPVEPGSRISSRSPNQEAPARWLYVAGIGSVAAVVIGGAALAVLRERSRALPPPVAASAPAMASPAPQVMVPPAESAPPLQDSAPSAVLASALPAEPVSAQPAVAVLVEKPAEQVPEPAPDARQGKPMTAEKPSPAPVVARQPAAATRTAREEPSTEATVIVESANSRPAGDDINRLARAAKQAIDAGNQAEAESALGQLAQRLPAESITLLRLRAWKALHEDDRPRAMMFYGQIVERLPGDESASINLAVLNWKIGQHEEARRIVARLAEQRPDSEAARRYLAQFGKQP